MKVENSRIYQSFEIDVVTVEDKDDDGAIATEVTVYLQDGTFIEHSCCRECCKRKK